MKVLYSLKGLTSQINQLPAKLSCHLFDSLVRPVLTFNAEIWYMEIYQKYFNSDKRASAKNEKPDYFSFLDKSIVDKVHTNFCKYTLSVKKSSSNIATRAELGREPIDSYVKTQSLLYEDRLINSDIPILKECYDVSKFLYSKGIYTWYSYVQHVRKDLRLSYDLYTNRNKNVNFKINKNCYKRESSNQYQEKFREKIEKLDENSKLQVFKLVKNEYNCEKYLDSLNSEYRKIICQMRISDHPLLIERGRYTKIPRNLRLCNSCNEIEDEFHFILKCTLNENLRTDFLKALDIFDQMNEEDKLKYILNPDSKEHVRLLGSFLKQSLSLRTGGNTIS